MKKTRVAILLVLIGMLMLLTGLSVAEEKHEEYGELLWLGGFPTYEPAETFTKSDFESYIVGQLKQQKTEIDVSSFGMTSSAFSSTYWATLNDHPELFYVDGRYTYYSSGGYVTSILPAYLYSGTDLTSRVAAFEAAVDEVVAYASASSTPIGKLLLANDYLCMNYEYDTDYAIYSPDQFFSQGEGVCQAYTLAYKAILNEMGFTSTSVTSQSMNHIWNVVLLDGSWYHIDVTWNDPLTDHIQRACHDNFLLSDAGITNADHYSWENKVTCSSTKYDNFFWMDVKTPIPVYGNTFYYVDPSSNRSSMKIMSWQPGSSTSSQVHTYNAYVSGLSYYIGYDSLACDGHSLFYVINDKIYSVPMAGGTAELIYTLSDHDGRMVYSSVALPGKNRINLAIADISGFSNETIKTIIASKPTSVALSASRKEVSAGQTFTLTLSFTPSYSTVPFEWSSDDTSIATVTSAGKVTAVAPGVATIRAKTYNGRTADCKVIIHYKTAIRLPSSLKTVGQEAFAGVKAQEVILPGGVTTISAGAFSGCTQLKMVTIPKSVTSIDSTAFDGCTQVVVLCYNGSTAHTFAKNNGLSFVLID